jgi:hypothetical protein
VSDPGGAVVPNVVVTATNTGNGQERSATSSGDGTYTISLLPPGTYTVKFSAAGFKTAEVGPVTITVTETPVLNRALEIGSQTEQVTVEANAETVQTSNATLGTVISTRTVTDLPLNTRNYTNLLALSAGVNSTTSSLKGMPRRWTIISFIICLKTGCSAGNRSPNCPVGSEETTSRIKASSETTLP